MNDIAEKTVVFNPGQLVLYEHGGEPLLAVVTGPKKARFHFIDERGRDGELDGTRLALIPGTLPANYATLEAKKNYLHTIKESAKSIATTIKFDDLWKVLSESPRDVSVSELCELYFSKDTLIEHCAMWYAVLNDPLYFKRHKRLFTPRTPDAVAQLLHVAEERAQTIKIREQFLEYLKHSATLAKGSHGVIPEEFQQFIHLLEELSVCSSRISPAQHKQGKELLELGEQAVSFNNSSGRIEERAFALLEHIGHYHEDTNLQLIHFRPRTAFSPQSLAEAHEASAPPPTATIHDYTSLLTVTIDDFTTKDMDDALSCEQTQDGYRVGIHITDLSVLIAKDSALDKESRKRATSIYLPEKTINMLPEAISEGSGSLQENHTRQCLSCFVNFSYDGMLLSSTLERTIIKVTKRLTYDQVDEILESQEQSGVGRVLQRLYELAVSHEIYRHEHGGSRIEKRDVLIRLKEDPTTKRIDFELEEMDEHAPARLLVAEMAVVANEAFALHAMKNNIPLVFRGQAQSRSESHDEEPTDNEPPPNGPALEYAKRSKLRKSLLSTIPSPHATLGLAAYAQVTSPIRRYLDLINQRQLVASIDGAPLPYTANELREIIDDVEERLGFAMTLSRDSKRYWLLKYIQQAAIRGELLSGTVTRNDLKTAMVEIDGIWSTLPVKSPRKLKLGERVSVRVCSVNPRWDQVRLEEAS